MIMQSISRLPSLCLLGILLVPQVGSAQDADVARDKLWAPSTHNYSRWRRLSPSQNAARAELEALQAQLQDAVGRDLISPPARQAAQANLAAAHSLLEHLADAPWQRQGAIEAKLQAHMHMLRATLRLIRPDETSAAVTGPVLFPGCAPPDDLQVCAATTPGAAPVACTSARPRHGQEGYRLQLPPGSYVVYARSPSVQAGLRAYFSNAVLCGLSVECKDHAPIQVHLRPGQVRRGVAPADWYGDPPASPTPTDRA